MKKVEFALTVLALLLLIQCKRTGTREIIDFTNDWVFNLGDVSEGQSVELNNNNWRKLNLPHDWSIEGEFDKENPATPGGGALPGGIGWYRKSFKIDESKKNKLIFMEFDGIYMNSEIWINGNYLGKRPYGYVSFRYELTPYIKYGDVSNIIAVKVDNSLQPNSRWYSGSGIYRNVRMVITNKIHIDLWGTYITTSEINEKSALATINTSIKNSGDEDHKIKIKTVIYNSDGKKVSLSIVKKLINSGSDLDIYQSLKIKKPLLWSVETPHLYRVISFISSGRKKIDEYITPFGIRYFEFDTNKGFSLNGKHIKINGVCNHHDLGCLGAAVNTRAIERQLEILKEMGVNAIRTSHNPPAPELLDLCDKMGLMVLDEAFDMWKRNKTPYDYGLYFDEWHKKDLSDFIQRDRNHPCVIIWSIGNEIMEQSDSSGIELTKELYRIVKSIDYTRPVTAACNPPGWDNYLIKPDVLDLIGYNYAHNKYPDFHKIFPGKKFISTESASSLATRGIYIMSSDSIRRWPHHWDIPFTDGPEDQLLSAYDNISAPWGSTQEEVWKVIKKYDFLSGMFIWTGFDYLGEPTPFGWPSRSSYFGIVDLAGFPKDSYYMYKSEWTNTKVLHVFPHWNWKQGDTIDIWVYTNCEEAELFLNDKSLGKKKKTGEELHLMWRQVFDPGTLKVLGFSDGKLVMDEIIKTAGKPSKIELYPDRSEILADGKDLSFVTVKIMDAEGNIVPFADNLVKFEIEGAGFIAGVDNGRQTSHEPFKADYRKAFNGLCLTVIQSNGENGSIKLTALSEGLVKSTITISAKK